MASIAEAYGLIENLTEDEPQLITKMVESCIFGVPIPICRSAEQFIYPIL